MKKIRMGTMGFFKILMFDKNVTEFCEITKYKKYLKKP